jgi:hypothetical protein
VLVVRLPHGGHQTVRVPVLGPQAAQARLAVRVVTHRDVQVRVLGPGSGATAIDVSASAAAGALPVGVHVGNVVLETGLSELPTLTLPYSIRVSGTLEVSPTNPYFNLRDPGAHAKTITVRSTAPDAAAFQVLAADIVSGPFAATVQKVGPGLFHILVRVRETDVPGGDRGVLGRLLIRSTDATEPTKEIPLFGFGSLDRGGRLTPPAGPADGGR